VNGSGQNVYFFSIQYNSYQYGNQILSLLVPTSLPSGYSTPSGFTSAPKFNLTGDGTGAIITPTISGGVITGTTILNQGSNYSSASLSLYGNSAGSGASFSVSIGKSVSSVVITAGGSGYTNGTNIPITFSAPTGLNGTTATGTINVVGNIITAFNLISGGSGYLTAPTITLPTGTGATFNITLSTTGNIGAITINNGGTNYPSTTNLFGNCGFPLVSRTPSIEILSNNFGTFLGFTTGLYPNFGFTTDYNVLNTFTPVGSNINNLIVRSSLVDNEVGFPTDIVDSMAITSTFGSNINYVPPVLKWVKLASGIYQYFTITFVDQNLNRVYALDNNICITLMIHNKGNEPPLGEIGGLRSPATLTYNLF
jgi:hypothetical protein